MERATIDKEGSNQYMEMWISDGILYGKYKKGVVVDLPIAKFLLEERLRFTEGKSYPVFVDVKEVTYWTKEARAFQATDENHAGVLAFGMYISSAVQRTIIKFYLYFNKPKVPTECFPTKEMTLAWLSQYK